MRGPASGEVASAANLTRLVACAKNNEADGVVAAVIIAVTSGIGIAVAVALSAWPARRRSTLP